MRKETYSELETLITARYALSKKHDENSGLISWVNRIFDKEKETAFKKQAEELSNYTNKSYYASESISFYSETERRYERQIKEALSEEKVYQNQINKLIEKEQTISLCFSRLYGYLLKSERDFSQFLHSKLDRQLLLLDKAEGNLQLEVFLYCFAFINVFRLLII